MRRTRQALFLVAALLCVGLVFALGSCMDDEDYTGDNVIVSFDSNGGSSVADVEVKKGENIPCPDDPTRDGYVFCGWFS